MKNIQRIAFWYQYLASATGLVFSIYFAFQQDYIFFIATLYSLLWLFNTYLLRKENYNRNILTTIWFAIQIPYIEIISSGIVNSFWIFFRPWAWFLYGYSYCTSNRCTDLLSFFTITWIYFNILLKIWKSSIGINVVPIVLMILLFKKWGFNASNRTKNEIPSKKAFVISIIATIAICAGLFILNNSKKPKQFETDSLSAINYVVPWTWQDNALFENTMSLYKKGLVEKNYSELYNSIGQPRKDELTLEEFSQSFENIISKLSLYWDFVSALWSNPQIEQSFIDGRKLLNIVWYYSKWSMKFLKVTQSYIWEKDSRKLVALLFNPILSNTIPNPTQLQKLTSNSISKFTQALKEDTLWEFYNVISPARKQQMNKEEFVDAIKDAFESIYQKEYDYIPNIDTLSINQTDIDESWILIIKWTYLSKTKQKRDYLLKYVKIWSWEQQLIWISIYSK